MNWSELRAIRPHLPESSDGYHQHPNGGGWVADSAQVADSATIAESAVVGQKVCVREEVRIGKGSCIAYRTHIRDKANVGEETYIQTGVDIGNAARIGNGAYVGHSTEIGPGVQIGDESHVDHGSRIGVTTSGRIPYFVFDASDDRGSRLIGRTDNRDALLNKLKAEMQEVVGRLLDGRDGDSVTLTLSRHDMTEEEVAKLREQ